MGTSVSLAPRFLEWGREPERGAESQFSSPSFNHTLILLQDGFRLYLTRQSENHPGCNREQVPKARSIMILLQSRFLLCLSHNPKGRYLHILISVCVWLNYSGVSVL